MQGMHAAAIAALLAVSGANVQASDIEAYQEYGQRVEAVKHIAALEPDAFGDQVNLFNRAVRFENVDISIPGNNALPVELRRSFRVERTPVDVSYETFGGLGNWDVDVPHIVGTFHSAYGWASNRCTAATVPNTGTFRSMDIWQGSSVQLPGRGSLMMIRSTETSQLPGTPAEFPWTTNDFSAFSCTTIKSGPISGEGFVLHTKDGLRYTFDVSVVRSSGTMKKSWGNLPIPLKAGRQRIYLLASRVEDRFGNRVDYQYNGRGHPVAISSSDDRLITLRYDTHGRLEKAWVGPTGSEREWAYTYLSGKLEVVRQPDNTAWNYLYDGSLHIEPDDWHEPMDVNCSPEAPIDEGEFALAVTHPSGAVARFEFRHARQYRSGVSRSHCVIDKQQASGVGNIYALQIPHYYDVFMLQRKILTGSALSSRTWTYGEESGRYPLCGNGLPGLCPDEPRRKIMTVTGPDGTQERHHYGVLFDINEGRLLAKFTRDSSANVIRGETYEYVTDQEASGHPYPNLYGIGYGLSSGLELKVRPLRKTLVALGGGIFEPPADVVTPRPPSQPPPVTPPPPRPPCEPGPVGGCLNPQSLPVGAEDPELVIATLGSSATTFANQAETFDSFARPAKVRRESSLGYARTETTLYHDDRSRWILGQPASVKCMVSVPASGACNGNDVVSMIEYDTYAMPWKLHTFGKLRQVRLYRTAGGAQRGTLSSVTDARNFTTSLSNWHRGVPTLVKHPGTPESPNGALESAEVNASGWLTSFTNGLGAQTGLQYDLMGRLTRLTLPAEVSSAGISWNPSIRDFSRKAGKYGLPQHWRLLVETGAARTVIRYDDMWRPVIEERYDNGNPDATRSIVVKRYDAAGRLAFQSFPVRTLADYRLVNAGTHYEYDPLGRITTTKVPSEDAPNGWFITTTEYLPGFVQRVTSPNLVVTSTQFQAWDEPVMDFPVALIHPAGAFTDITRDAFGKPMAITRRNAGGTVSLTRSYGYNVHHELCRSIEPETGATLMGYDEAGNLTWSAAGLPASTSCHDTGETPAIAARRVDRSYDARGRLTSLLFPDGNGNQSWRYDADGKPTQISTWNIGFPGAAPAETRNLYTYFNRGLLKSEVVEAPSWYTFPVEHGYNANGHQTSLTYPSGHVVTSAVNALGQPTSISGGGTTYASSIAYHPNGAVKSFFYGNNIVHTMEQNDRQMPDTVLSAHGSTDFLHDQYDYDGHGNVLAITDKRFGADGRRSRSMQYDDLDRLTEADAPKMYGANGVSYRYNVLDNIVSVQREVPKFSRQSYCYDSSNRLVAIRSLNCSGFMVTDMSYDVQGNLSSRDVQPYRFDYGNRLREVDGVERYRYDGHGRRVLANRIGVGNVLSQYGLDGRLLYQRNERNSLTLDHVYLGPSLLAIRERDVSGGTPVVKYQHTDALGSPVAVTLQDRTIAEETEYEPYGKVINRPSRDGAGYTGHVEDAATGMIQMQQRYYDPGIGMMLSADPVAAFSDPAVQFHRYRYANSSPYRFFDPDGRRAIAFDEDEPPPPPTEMETVVVRGERQNSSQPTQTMPSVVVTGVRPHGGSSPSPVPSEPQQQYRCPGYGDRYMSHLDEYLINVGPYASALGAGLMPKSMAPATGGRGPLLGSKNPLTSVPRGFGVPGAGHWVARTGAAGVGIATVGIGFYNVGVFGSGLAYAIPENAGCP